MTHATAMAGPARARPDPAALKLTARRPSGAGIQGRRPSPQHAQLPERLSGRMTGRQLKGVMTHE